MSRLLLTSRQDCAAKVLAATAIGLATDPALLQRAEAERAAVA